MYRDLTKGSITKGLLRFALPMIAGNLLQQLYNIADTLIVGQALGKNALAICTVSNHLLTGEETTPEERQNYFSQMIELALELA